VRRFGKIGRTGCCTESDEDENSEEICTLVLVIFLYLAIRWLTTFRKLWELCFIEFEDELLETLGGSNLHNNDGFDQVNELIIAQYDNMLRRWLIWANRWCDLNHFC
jgi:hypothetical protein